MASKKNIDKTFFLIAILFAVSILFLFITVLLSGKKSESIRIRLHTAEDFNDGWYYFDKDKGKTNITLPCKVPVTRDGTARIFHQIENTDKDRKYKSDLYLDFYDNNQNIRITFGIKMIYEYISKSTLKWLKTYRSFHHIIHIPAYERGSLCIETRPSLKTTESDFPPILIGSQNEIIASIILQNYENIIIAFILLVASIIFLISAQVYIKIEDSKIIIYLSLMLFLIGFCLLEESGILQFFIGNQVFHWFLKYPFQFLIIMASFALIRDIAKKSASKDIFILFSIGFALITVQIVLQITGTAQFPETNFINCIIYALDSLYIIWIVNTSKEYSMNKITKIIFNTTSVLAFFSFVSGFITQNKIKNISRLIDLSIILIIISLLLIIYQRLFFRAEQFKMSLLYRKLAFIDVATGVSSKTAWYTLTEQFEEKNNKFENCCLLMFDMNNLKTINDKYGHLAGDKVISSFCNCLIKSVGMIGEIFRIGGDEFICFCNNITKEKVEESLRHFTALTERQTDSEIPFTVAFGASYFTPHSKKDFSDAQIEADKNMYADKKTKKEEKSISL